MKNADLKIITNLSKVYPELLPHFKAIYDLGYKQGIIDQLKININKLAEKHNV